MESPYYNPYTYNRPAHGHFPTAPSSTSSLVSNVSLSTTASSFHLESLLPDLWGNLADDLDETNRLCSKSRLWSVRREVDLDHGQPLDVGMDMDMDLNVSDLMAHLDLEVPMGPQDSSTVQDFWSLSTLSSNTSGALNATIPTTQNATPIELANVSAELPPTKPATGAASASATMKRKRTKNRKKSPKTNPDLYKTEPCVAYAESLKTDATGKCPYGDKCQFAHGADELRSVADDLRPKNYRSKKCVNWQKFGVCVYNDRCCFRHE